VNLNSEIPLWGVITAALTAIVSVVSWTFRLSSRLEKVERELADVKSDVHSLDEKLGKDQGIWMDIRERLVRIETKLEEKR
jgi:hypothetical protein